MLPQGSILGPKLFILYINDICNASTSLKFILFADDTNVFYSGVDIQTICECISRELDKLHVWLSVNKLSLNVDKKISFYLAIVKILTMCVYLLTIVLLLLITYH